MARAFSPTVKALLRSPDLHVNVLATFFLDEGTYRFCDDQAGYDLYDPTGGNTYLGANALTEAVDIRSSGDLAAEPVTLILDGNRMAQYGIQDPARVLSDMLAYLHTQRRVDYAFAYRYSYSKEINLIIPAYAGKINSVRLIDEQIDAHAEGARVIAKLEIVLDSLAARYSRATNRTRSHEDQLEIDPTDNFYSFTTDAVINASKIYWGRAAPFNASPTGQGGMMGGFGTGEINYNQYMGF